MPIILHHHERYAGHGYPFGLRASEIPLGARIVAVADAYDAMVHDRPYKRAMTHEAAIAELRRHAGTQFDPELVESFCDLYANEAPAPDPAVLAMIAGSTAHAAMVPTTVRRSWSRTPCPGRPAGPCAVGGGPTMSRPIPRRWGRTGRSTSRRPPSSRARRDGPMSRRRGRVP